jgi:DNA gyrase subunit A
VLPIRDYEEELHLHGDRDGTVKKTSLVAFSRPRTAGIIAVGSIDGDKLVGRRHHGRHSDVMMFTTRRQGDPLCRRRRAPMGRNAAGVRGIRMPDGETVISLIIPDPQG